MDLQSLSIKNLLCLQASIINELKTREVVRTKNNPLGDYTEWLVADLLKLDLVSNFTAGYDAINPLDNTRVQIKGRRVTASNKSRQLGAIRNYEKQDFDLLAAVIFDEDFNVIEALLIPHEVIGKYASFRAHTNGHILVLKGQILKDEQIKSFKHLVSNVEIIEQVEIGSL